MPTIDQRLSSIADAVFNRASTPAERARLGKALAWKAGQLDAYNAGSAAEKSQIALRGARALLVGAVEEYEVVVAQQTTAQAVVDARNSARTGFAETP